MRKRASKFYFTFILIFTVSFPPSYAHADFFGGDLPLLAEIVANTLQQLYQLRDIMGNGVDSLQFMRDVNAGIRDAMGIMQTLNTTIRPGVMGDLQSPEDVLKLVQEMYGFTPKTSEAKVEQLTDQTVAEAIALHNQAFQYADKVDPEAERIKEYARGTSPAGSGRLTAQSLGVLIHVTNQLLRTNAAMLKVMSENLALQNRKEKLNSNQFKVQYEGLAKALGSGQSFRVSSQLQERR